MEKGTKVFVGDLNKLAIVKEWDDRVDEEYGTSSCMCYVLVNKETYKVYKEDCTEVRKVKFNSKISYQVNREEEFCFLEGEFKEIISSREADVYISANTKEDVEAVLYSLIDLAEENGYVGSACWQVEEFEGEFYASEQFQVGNREDYEDFKAMYKSWKKFTKEVGIY